MKLQLSKNETRMLTGYIIGLLVLACLYFGGIFLFLLITLFVCLASKEYVEILKHKSFFPSLKVILVVDLV
ncbi:phosphatidate cytidylyltransferase, partial [bacterium]|nr:phosphatidate cytidylyltransferase [bacterium]